MNSFACLTGHQQVRCRPRTRKIDFVTAWAGSRRVLVGLEPSQVSLPPFSLPTYSASPGPQSELWWYWKIYTCIIYFKWYILLLEFNSSILILQFNTFYSFPLHRFNFDKILYYPKWRLLRVLAKEMIKK